MIIRSRWLPYSAAKISACQYQKKAPAARASLKKKASASDNHDGSGIPETGKQEKKCGHGAK